MSSTTRLLLIISVGLLSASAPATAYTLTAYDVLQLYLYPVGLLPKGVTSFELDPSTDKFSVYLNQTCSFTVDGYDIKYNSTISGTISTDKITNLVGVQVKVLFVFWVDIIEVTNKLLDGELEFSIGFASQTFPEKNFNESPQCGCGFDCVNAVAGKRSRKFSFKKAIPLLQYNI